MRCERKKVFLVKKTTVVLQVNIMMKWVRRTQETSNKNNSNINVDDSTSNTSVKSNNDSQTDINPVTYIGSNMKDLSIDPVPFIGNLKYFSIDPVPFIGNDQKNRKFLFELL